MGIIAWYKSREGLFYFTKGEKRLLSFYIFFLFLFATLLFIPFPTYQHYIGVKVENTLSFSIPSSHFSLLQTSKLFIDEKEYPFEIIEKKEDKIGFFLVVIKVKKEEKIKHSTVELIFKGKKKSKVDQLMEFFRKELVLSPN